MHDLSVKRRLSLYVQLAASNLHHTCTLQYCICTLTYAHPYWNSAAVFVCLTLNESVIRKH